MPTDVSIIMPNTPGTLARLLGLLADEGISLHSGSGDIRPGQRWGIVHFLVDDPDRVREIAEGAGYEVAETHGIELHDLEDRPGALLELLQSYLDKGDNVDLLYMSASGKWVVGAESMRSLRLGVKMGEAGTTPR